jgi:hypothetical protein
MADRTVANMLPLDPKRTRTPSDFDGLPDPRLVISVAAAFIVVIVAVGLAAIVGQDPTTPPASPAPIESPTTVPTGGVEDVITLLPEGTPVGLLDRQDVEIGGGLVSTLVTTDGSGKVEYGIVVEGDVAALVDADELSVVTASGLEFSPQSLNRDAAMISTTINAEHGAERWVALRWVDDGVVRFLLHNGWDE